MCAFLCCRTCHDNESCACLQHPSRPLLASACSDGNVHITSMQRASLQNVTMIPVAEDLGFATMCSAVSFSPDGCMLAVGTRCGLTAAYCASSWRLLRLCPPSTPDLPPLGVTACAWDAQVLLPPPSTPLRFRELQS